MAKLPKSVKTVNDILALDERVEFIKKVMAEGGQFETVCFIWEDKYGGVHYRDYGAFLRDKVYMLESCKFALLEDNRKRESNDE